MTSQKSLISRNSDWDVARVDTRCADRYKPAWTPGLSHRGQQYTPCPRQQSAAKAAEAPRPKASRSTTERSSSIARSMRARRLSSSQSLAIHSPGDDEL